MPDRMLSVAEPPAVRQMGVSVHGEVPVERWSNLTFWSLHAYHYRAVLIAGGEEVTLEPGCVTLLMPGEDLEYRFAGPSRHVYAHFLPVDSLRERRRAPIVQRLGEDFGRFEADLREAVGWFPHETLRARVRLWDLLWRLTRPADAPTAYPPALSRALELIELNLAACVSVTELAEQVDLSPAHLTRLFRRHLAASPLQHILRRRTERAQHLLKHTTLPIKAIAREVGLRDLQQFNKLLRQRTGRSPRKLREPNPLSPEGRGQGRGAKRPTTVGVRMANSGDE